MWKNKRIERDGRGRTKAFQCRLISLDEVSDDAKENRHEADVASQEQPGPPKHLPKQLAVFLGPYEDRDNLIRCSAKDDEQEDDLDRRDAVANDLVSVPFDIDKEGDKGEHRIDGDEDAHDDEDGLAIAQHGHRVTQSLGLQDHRNPSDAQTIIKEIEKGNKDSPRARDTERQRERTNRWRRGHK